MKSEFTVTDLLSLFYLRQFSKRKLEENKCYRFMSFMKCFIFFFSF